MYSNLLPTESVCCSHTKKSHRVCLPLIKILFLMLLRGPTASYIVYLNRVYTLFVNERIRKCVELSMGKNFGVLSSECILTKLNSFDWPLDSRDQQT